MGMGLLGGAEVNGAVLGRAHVGAYPFHYALGRHAEYHMNLYTCTVYDVICDFGFSGTILYPTTRGAHG